MLLDSSIAKLIHLRPEMIKARLVDWWARSGWPCYRSMQMTFLRLTPR